MTHKAQGFGQDLAIRDATSYRPEKRATRTKVRTGCLTCKARRVKCDETKPECLRCRRSNRKCDGYNIPDSISPAVYEASDEKRGYQFFVERVMPELSEYLSTPFWGGHVRQLAHSQPVMKHLLVSIGAYAEGLERLYYVDDKFAIRTDPAPKVGLEHCNKAIETLTRGFEQVSMDTLVTTSVLLIFMMQLVGEYGAALKHLANALMIVQRIQTSGVPERSLNRITKSFVLPILSRLESQHAPFFEGTGLIGIPRRMQPIRLIHDANFTVPANFKNLFEAHTSFEKTMENIATSFRGQHDGAAHNLLDHESLVPRNLRLLSQWLAHFQSYRNQNMKLADDHVRQSYLYLRIEYILARIMVETMHNVSEMVFDKYELEFQQVNTYAEAFLDIRGNPTLSNRLYGFELRILWPLYLTAVYCRHPSIRRKSVALLRRYGRQEGPWDSRVSSTISEHIILEEEKDLELDGSSSSKDIPQENRIRWTRFWYNQKHWDRVGASNDGDVGIQHLRAPFDFENGDRHMLWVPWLSTNRKATDKINPRRFDQAPSSYENVECSSMITSRLRCGCVGRYFHFTALGAVVTSPC